jgi:hypothetical protein
MMIPLSSEEIAEIKTNHYSKWLAKRSKIALALFGVPQRGVDLKQLSAALDRHAAEAVAIELGLLDGGAVK